MHPWFSLVLHLALSLPLTLGLGGTGVASAAGDAALTGLATLRWQYRVILIDAHISGAIERLRGAQQAIDDRDVLWFVNDQGRLQSNYPGSLSDALAAEVERQYFSRSDTAVFLIGKDGGLKASDQRLDLPRLFERIDAMPMRQREVHGAQ